MVGVDSVMVELSLNAMDGVEACRLVRDRVPGVNVVMLTSFEDEQATTASILAGARGFLLKNGGPGELLHAVRAADFAARRRGTSSVSDY